jgi:hypothetical protein
MVRRARYNPWLLKADFQIGHLLTFAKCLPLLGENSILCSDSLHRTRIEGSP